MNFLFDGRSLTQTPVTGVQRYARDMAAWLKRLGVSFDLWHPPFGGRWLGQAFRHTLLPLRAARYDLLFCPANLGPWRLASGTPLVVTLHCLRVIEHPEWYSQSFAAFYRFMLPRTIARADAIITVSRAIAGDIAARFPSAQGKLHVVPLGLDDAFLAQGPREPGPRSVLFVGGVSPGKGLATLAEALAILNDPSVELVIAGERESILWGDSLLGGLLGKLGPARVRCVQTNEPAEMARLYRQASLTVVPSRYESFGLPALEAMGSGCPVIASDIPALRETLSDAGVFFPVGDAQALAKAMQQVLTDLALHANLAAAGRARASAFSWRACAEATMNVLNKAMEA